MGVRSIIASLASVIFPAPCRICGEFLEEIGALPVCANCWKKIEAISAAVCEICGRPFPGDTASLAERVWLCRLCRARKYAFDRARSFGTYNETMRRAILLLKYEEMAPFAEWFAGRIAAMILSSPEIGAENLRAEIVVPVPLHRAHHRERGYNQAELIARPLARMLHLPCEPRALERIRPRPDKLLLSRSERWKSVRGAYRPSSRRGIAAKSAGRSILLVDDVFTTGATLDACSRALLDGGVKRVVGVTAARAIYQRDFSPARAGTAKEVENQEAVRA